MNKNKTRLSFIVSLFLGVQFSFGLNSADLKLQLDQLERDVKRIDIKMFSTDSLAKLETTRFETKKEIQVSTSGQKKSELNALSTQLKKLQGKIQSEGFKQSSFKIRTENHQRKFQESARKLALITEQFAQQIKSGIPWDLDSRVARVMALKRDLEAETASQEEGVNRIASLIREEIKFNDEIVIAEKSLLRNSGELINVQMLRLGNQWLVYMDSDGKNYGRLIRKISDGIKDQNITQGQTVYAWDEDLDFLQRKAIREAIEIKMAKKAPELLLLPLSLSVIQGGDK